LVVAELGHEREPLDRLQPGLLEFTRPQLDVALKPSPILPPKPLP
jgi:hypothetical protein